MNTIACLLTLKCAANARQIAIKSPRTTAYNAGCGSAAFRVSKHQSIEGELQSRRLRPLWWQFPERFRSLAVYEVSHKYPENISHFLIVRL
jgi:hypothetical protein